MKYTSIGVVVLFSLLYFFAFGQPLDGASVGNYNYILNYNFPDHLVYLDVLDRIEAESFTSFDLGINNYGIAYFYYVISFFGSTFFYENVENYTFVINSILSVTQIFLLYSMVNSIGGSISPWFIVTCPTFYFFGAMINKDSLVATLFLLIIACTLNKKYILSILFLISICAIRIQFMLMLMIFFPIIISRCTVRTKFLLIYLFSAVIGVFASNLFKIVQLDVEGGLNSFVDQMNVEYYIGSLVFNWLKIVRYLIIPFESFDKIIVGDEINFLEIFYLLSGIYIFYNFARIFILRNKLIGAHVNSEILIILLFCWGYINLLVVSPVTEYRYFLMLLPLVIIFSAKKTVKSL